MGKLLKVGKPPVIRWRVPRVLVLDLAVHRQDPCPWTGVNVWLTVNLTGTEAALKTLVLTFLKHLKKSV